MANHSPNGNHPQTPGRRAADRRASYRGKPVFPLLEKWLDLLREGDTAAVGLVLFVVVVWAFLPSLANGFVNFDDDLYVYENVHVRGGLTSAGVEWAFTASDGGLWHPLTWLSLMGDSQLFGLRAGGYHLTSLLLHATSTVLLFLLLVRLTHATWRSAFVAALFGLHPLHVESVAWAAERKDVLCAFFWMLTLLLYARYARESKARDRRSKFSYALALLAFACGAMSKAMIVSLPVVLLLLDWWPLRRFPSSRAPEASASPSPLASFESRQGLPVLADEPPTCHATAAPPSVATAGWLLLEKVPFLLVALACGLGTLLAQREIGALRSVTRFSMADRLANAVLSYGTYIAQAVWPSGLAVYYPYPSLFPVWRLGGMTVLLLTVTIAVGRGQRQRPYLAFGWCWYLVTLAPVIGLVQVGGQAHADRYTYLPLVGLFILLAWGAEELRCRCRIGADFWSVVAVAVLIACTAATRLQLGYWHDSESLYRHTLAVTRDNYVALNNLGVALLRKGQVDEAAALLQETTRLAPRFATGHYGLGDALAAQGRYEEAVLQYEETLKLQPNNTDALLHLGRSLNSSGRIEEAIKHFRSVLAQHPGSSQAHFNLGLALARQGQLDAAVDEFRHTLRLSPGDAAAASNLGAVLGRKGDLDGAIGQFQYLLTLAPRAPAAHCNLADALALKGRSDEAISQYHQALELNPQYAEAHRNLGLALRKQGQFDEAIDHLQTALRLRPADTSAQDELNAALAEKAASEKQLNPAPSQ
jgi:protein O-mannosyl-transferase